MKKVILIVALILIAVFATACYPFIEINYYGDKEEKTQIETPAQPISGYLPYSIITVGTKNFYYYESVNGYMIYDEDYPDILYDSMACLTQKNVLESEILRQE